MRSERKEMKTTETDTEDSIDSTVLLCDCEGSGHICKHCDDRLEKSGYYEDIKAEDKERLSTRLQELAWMEGPLTNDQKIELIEIRSLLEDIHHPELSKA